jgi:cob(I)alamin adenosyltransferase
MKSENMAAVDQETGLIQVYSSPSGKMNFAPFGLALRASGYGLRTLITRFVHHELERGEKRAVATLAPNLVIDTSALKGPADSAMVEDGIKEAFQKAEHAAVSGAYDLVVLDGVLEAVSKGAVSVREVVGLMQGKAAHVELLLTGPGASDEIMAEAHLVTEMEVQTVAGDAHQSPVEVVTGRGKGKTTYCLGKALLMSSMGVRSFILQVIKSPKPYGEVMAIENLPGMEIQSMGKGLVDKENPDGDQRHREAAREAWEQAKEIVLSSRYGLVVLDEINIAVNYGFIHPDELLNLLSRKPKGLHLMLSGRYAKSQVMAQATDVMEMKEIIHPFKNGVGARRGIEY